MFRLGARVQVKPGDGKAEGSMMRTSVVIDLVSDVICPWCFLGKRRLDKAIALVPEADVAVRWRPFFLDPTIPPEGQDRRQYLVNKFGEERLKTLHEPLEAAGKVDDVPYAFDKITRTPNTVNAHRVIRWAGESGVQQDVVEALFLAYWRDGRDVGDSDTLVTVAKSCGMDGKQVKRDLNSDRDRLEVFTKPWVFKLYLPLLWRSGSVFRVRRVPNCWPMVSGARWRNGGRQG
jgi:predicted DsbA family dithiol-disulfide isomerase